MKNAGIWVSAAITLSIIGQVLYVRKIRSACDAVCDLRIGDEELFDPPPQQLGISLSNAQTTIKSGNSPLKQVAQGTG
jgi:hypothetical protein